MSKIEYYELRKVTIEPPKKGEFVIQTAAMICCRACGEAIDGMGGPGHNPICLACGDGFLSGTTRR